MADQPLFHDPRFEVTDFHLRWSRARRAALKNVLGTSSVGDEVSEDLLIDRVEPSRHDELLRAVFDQSRRLGISLSRHLGLSLDIEDLENLLRTSGIGCFTGEWSHRPSVRLLRRPGCGSREKNPLFCSYWREAADGLVMGAGEQERFVRHGNVLSGDPLCEDVLFLEEVSRPEGRLGRIPARFDAGLNQVRELFRSIYRMDLQFPGYADGVLYYLIRSDSAMACGPGASLLERTLQRKLEALQPGLRVQDASPRTILSGAE